MIIARHPYNLNSPVVPEHTRKRQMNHLSRTGMWYVMSIIRKLVLGLVMLASPVSCAISGEPLHLSILPMKQTYSVGENIEVTVSLRRVKSLREANSIKELADMDAEERKAYFAANIVPMVLLCEGPYLSFHFAGDPPVRIMPQAQYVESDFDLMWFASNPTRHYEIQQRVNLNACYQLGQGRYTLHAVYDTTKRKAACDVCRRYEGEDHDDRYMVWSGVVKSESITIEIIE